ncbi:MAG: XTP/dITP diphosphatase [Lentisphaeria bacterium]|nr:XTP/dITP diphosphatase [Lentisphaeria bacterium]
MSRLIVATSNAHKVQEIREILCPLGIEVLSAKEAGGMPDVVEDGNTFEENAIKKALAGARAFGCAVMADDSGLEVKALNGEPGIYSARYAGEGGNDGRNLAKLLKNLEGVTDRSARFVCAIAVANGDGTLRGTVCGECRGKIAAAAFGTGGFGYDPAFIPDGYDKTFGELPAEVKNALSHRGNALKAAVEKLFGEER